MSSKHKETVIVAMSGGVDSSVAAGLLKKQGYNIIGATLLFKPCDDDEQVSWCCGVGAQEAASSVSGTLKIPHYTINCASEFNRYVLKPSWQEYSNGKTPSPCIICNKELKFNILVDLAKKLGATKVATGHYAKISQVADDQTVYLKRACYRAKDQSYFLFALTNQHLDYAMFPLGNLTKTQVREIAREQGFSNAERPESQDACFAYGDGGFAEGLRIKFGDKVKSGDIIDTNGKKLGIHPGIHRYTIGQRKGLGIALGKRAYVIEIDSKANKVILDIDESKLMSKGLTANRVNWIGGYKPVFPLKCQAQIRYRSKEVAVTVNLLSDSEIQVEFESPQKAVAKGQAVVFYDEDRVLGGGWITDKL